MRTRKDWMRRMTKMRMKSLMKTKRTRSPTPVCVIIHQLYEIVKNLQKIFFIDAVRIVCELGSV